MSNRQENSKSKKRNNAKSKKTEPVTTNLNEEQLKEISGAFTIFDLADESAINAKDLQAALRLLDFELKKEELQGILSDLNLTRSSKIDYDTFLRIVEAKMSERDVKEELIKVFAMFDEDKTGKISFKNLKRVAEEFNENMDDEEVLEMIKEADKNGDGEIDQDEFIHKERPLSTVNVPSQRPVMASDPKTPATYAIAILIRQFIRLAERKVNNVMSWSVDREPDFMKIVGPGADPAFDKLLNSLGYIARHRPKSVIDQIMNWRKSKTEKPADVPDIPTHKRTHSDGALVERTKDMQAILSERKAQVTMFILCRTLLEIINQLQPNALAKEHGAELETLVFDQIRISDPILILKSKSDVFSREMVQKIRNREASFNLFAELIGSLSSIRFGTVSDRFIAELEQYGKLHPNVLKEHESKITMLISGIRYLRLKIYPEDALIETADFLQSLAGFLKVANGARIKHAYADLFVQLLVPIAGVANAEVNFPAWVTAVDMLYPKAIKMAEKLKNSDVAYTFTTTLLCVSKREFFTQNWWACADYCIARFKDKERRQMALGCVVRLVWTFLYRCHETTGNTQKKLDNISKILFPSNRRPILPSDTCIELFVLYVYYVGFKPQHYDYCLKNIIFYLLNSDLMSSHYSSLSIDYIAPERMHIGIRAFGLLLTAMLNPDMKPPFLNSLEPRDIMAQLLKLGNTSDILPESFFNRPGLKETFQKFCEIAWKIIWVVDSNHYGSMLLIYDERHLQPRSSVVSPVGDGVVTAMSENTIYHSYATLSVTYSRDKQPYLDLLKTYIRALPRLLPLKVNIGTTIEMLCRYTVHLDPDLAKAAAQALGRIAAQCGADIVIMGFSRFVYQIEDKYAEILAGVGPGTGTKFGGVLKLYLELLRVWLDQLRGNNPIVSFLSGGVESSINTDNSKNITSTEPDNQTIRTIIEETEANGLLFLCSQCCNIRKYAVDILKHVAELELEYAQRRNNELPLSRRNTLPESSDHSLNTSRSNDEITVVEMESGQTTIKSESNVKLHYSVNNKENKKPYTRVIHVLGLGGGDLIKFDKLVTSVSQTPLTIVEQIRLQKLQQQGKKDVLLRLVESEHSADIVIWSRCFPEFMKICFERFPVTVALCRNNVCIRIVRMNQTILNLSESFPRAPTTLSMTRFHTKSVSPTDEIINQWRSYLIVACSTITLLDDYTDRIPPTERKRSESIPGDRITSARALFRRILGFLYSDHNLIRDAVVVALGNINSHVYKVLLNDLKPYIKFINDDHRSKSATKNYPTILRRMKKWDRVRTEVARVLQLTGHFLLDTERICDRTIETWIMEFVKDTISFLREPELTNDFEFQKLRQYFCGLIEKLYEGISRLNNIKSELEIMPFEMRLSLFNMFEEWCGHGEKGRENRDRDGKLISLYLENFPKDPDERRPIAAQLETERKALELAALNAMAALCKGPLKCVKENDKPIFFDDKNLLKWIESVFNDPQDKLHPIARRAIEGLLVSNANDPFILNHFIGKCYTGNPSMKSTQGFFLAIAHTLFKVKNYPLEYPCQIIALALFKVGDPELEIRQTAISLLKIVEKRFYNECCAAEYEIGITSQLSSIYEQAQIALSTRLAHNARKRDEEKRIYNEGQRNIDGESPADTARPDDKLFDETYYILSEFTLRFDSVREKGQRDMLNYFLPWLRNIGFIVTEDDVLHPTTNMIISNLFFITLKYGDIHVKEVELIWQQLVTGEHVANIRAIVKYLIDVGLEKRNPNFVIHAKRVFVFLGRTPACAAVIERLTSEITPKSMTPQPRENGDTAKKATSDLWYANFDEVLPAHNKRPVFSAGQLAMLYMVDMAVEAGSDLQIYLPLLLHVLFVQVDSANPLISEEARALLVNLIYSIIIGKCVYPDAVEMGTALVTELNCKEGPQLWPHEDISYSNRSISSLIDLERLSKDVVNIFQHGQEALLQMWGEQALEWATSCPVRHIACRSFQIFRSLKPAFNERMLADMLSRLSNTIADTSVDIQGFALEILISLSHVVDCLPPSTKENFPQLLWATIACLETINEPEYLEALTILDKLLDKFDMQDQENQALFWGFFPENKWKGTFEGIQPLLMKGIRSSISLQPTFNMLRKLMHLHDDSLIDRSEGRLLFLLLANLPRMVDALNNDTIFEECTEWAQALASFAEHENRHNLERILTSYIKGRFRRKEENFMKEIIVVIRDNYFSVYESQILLFLMGLLSNKIPYYKLMTMKILKLLLPYVDTSRVEYDGIGAELILPLLRLLPTQYAQEALEVLDEAISITGGPKDKHILRMSINAKRVQKDFDTTASLFGNPEESGWAVPDPVITASHTRSNVQAVCSTCKSAMALLDYEFYPELAGDFTNSYSSETPTRRNQFSEIEDELRDLDNYFGPGDDDSDIVIGDDSIDVSTHTPSITYSIPRIIHQDLGDESIVTNSTKTDTHFEAAEVLETHMSKPSSLGSLRSFAEHYSNHTTKSSTDSSSTGKTVVPLNGNLRRRDSEDFARFQLMSSTSFSEEDVTSWNDYRQTFWTHNNNSGYPPGALLQPRRTGGSLSHGATPYDVDYS
ncbi:hypothetical protein G9A89_017078 [Geosiphon pyriformis]|nr:hypothetical protein G9A89_017078 [Geosiphon pyriformis]